MNERESTNAKVDDLEKPVNDQTAEQVKGGATAAADGSVTPSPILIKQVNPRSIVPCI